MRKELEQKLVERWTAWFNVEGDIRHTLMPFGCQCGDGWFELLWRLCEDSEPLVNKFERETGNRFEVLQVKEKFGGLRFYTNYRSEAIQERIEAAAVASFKTCEICGQPGRLREGSYVQTLCDHCASSREPGLRCQGQ